jgi:hypothetical protein
MRLTASAFILPAFALTLTSCTNQAPVSSQPAAATPSSPQNSAPKPADIQGTPAGTVMTPEYVASVGRIAYLWGWPLVNNLNRSLGVKDLPGPGLIGDVVPAAPPGYIAMLTDYISYKEQFVTCPNQDTVYGAGRAHQFVWQHR